MLLSSSSELSAHYLHIGNASFSANWKDMVADVAILSNYLTTDYSCIFYRTPDI